MKFKFIGQYTNGHTSITYGDVTFEGHDPSDVTDEDWIRRLSGSQEFEQVGKGAKDPLDHDGDGKKGGSTAGRDVEAMRALRAEYERVVGKKPFSGWNADVLRQKMAAFEDDGA